MITIPLFSYSSMYGIASSVIVADAASVGFLFASTSGRLFDSGGNPESPLVSVLEGIIVLLLCFFTFE